MLALVMAAHALECGEVINMQEAGVPPEEIVRQMNVAGTPIDRDFISCISAWDAGPQLLEAAWRLERSATSREVRLHSEHEVPKATWVELDVTCGSVAVEGGEERLVIVDGKGAPGSQLVAAASGGGLRFHVDVQGGLDAADVAQRPQFTRQEAPQPPTVERPCADLKVQVPRETKVVVKSTRADVRVWFVGGPVELTSHFGNLEVVGNTPEIVLKTTSGNIRSDTGAKHVDIETVSGMVEVSAGEGARVVATSISGAMWVWGGPIQRLDVNSVSGDLRLNAAMMDSGTASLQTHKGSIEARVPTGEVVVSSHEGFVSGPSRMVRPDGPTQRVNRTPAKPPDRFGGLALLGPETYGVWAKDVPERWWFRSGAVFSRSITRKSAIFTLTASSFSGNVRVDAAETFPAPTGPLIAQLEAVRPRLDACSDAQHQRTPQSSGHAVVSLRLGFEGEVLDVKAPAVSANPADLSDGAFSSCLVRALEKVQFDRGGGAEVRWPVAYQPPVQIVPVQPGALNPMVEIRKRPLR
ncbi:MAG: DUF4097 family beta strand repeat-containing protein [Myxococcota bacterium]